MYYAWTVSIMGAYLALEKWLLDFFFLKNKTLWDLRLWNLHDRKKLWQQTTKQRCKQYRLPCCSKRISWAGSASVPFDAVFLASWQKGPMHGDSSPAKRRLIGHLNMHSFQNSISVPNIQHKYVLFEGILLLHRFPSLYARSTHTPSSLRQLKASPLIAQEPLPPPWRKTPKQLWQGSWVSH